MSASLVACAPATTRVVPLSEALRPPPGDDPGEGGGGGDVDAGVGAGDSGVCPDACAGVQCGLRVDCHGDTVRCGAFIDGQTDPSTRTEFCRIGVCSDLLHGGTCSPRCQPNDVCGTMGTCDPDTHNCARTCHQPFPEPAASWVCDDGILRRACATHDDCGDLDFCRAGACHRSRCTAASPVCERPGYICNIENNDPNAVFVCVPGCGLPTLTHQPPDPCPNGGWCNTQTGHCIDCTCVSPEVCRADGSCYDPNQCHGPCAGSPCDGCPGVCVNDICYPPDPCAGIVCPGGGICSGGTCIGGSGCFTDFDCPGFQVCEGGTCVDSWPGGDTCALDGICSPGETCACDAYCCGGSGGGGGSGSGGGCGWDGGPTISYGDCSACGGRVDWNGSAFECTIDSFEL